MQNIAIVGAGQLGSRHLQGLLKLDLPSQFHVVDPSARSLEIAEARAEEIVNRGAPHAIVFHERLSDLPQKIDYCVIATSSDVRLDVLRTLLATREVRSILLEKVLFQREQEYTEALDLVEQSGALAWVNCSRRLFPIYSEVAEHLRGDAIVRFSVTGGDWGLGCNVVHFLDLFAMLSGDVAGAVDTSLLDPLLVPSKRPGFLEFTGELHARSATGRFSACSTARTGAPLLVEIVTQHYSCCINETAGVATFFEGDSKVREVRFSLPYLSETSAAIAACILSTGECGLPTLVESSACHRPLISALAEFAHQNAGTPLGLCPIT